MTDPIIRDLAEHRVRLGLTQGEAARRVGVHRSTLNRWECGHASPRMSELRRYVAVVHAELNLTVKENVDG